MVVRPASVQSDAPVFKMQMQSNILDYNSPSSLKAYMEAFSLAMRKQYGQNFLINHDARRRLSDAVCNAESSFCNEKGKSARAGSKSASFPRMVWEVGPGLGCMTEEFLRRSLNVTAFEIDKAFIASMKSFFPRQISSGQLKIVEGDVLKTLPREINHFRAHTSGPLTNVDSGLQQNNSSPLLFGNLPYNIAATLIASMIENAAKVNKKPLFDRCVITVQKEVAERMASMPDGKSYSSLSVVCQWAYKIRHLMDISPASFWPKPRVASRSLVLDIRDDFPNCLNARLFVKMTRALFSSRRKTVRNNLASFLSGTGCNEGVTAEDILSMAGIDKNSRAQTLDIKTLLNLCDTIERLASRAK